MLPGHRRGRRPLGGEVDAAGCIGAWRERRRELRSSSVWSDLERELVRVERAVRGSHGSGWPGIGRSTVQVGSATCVLVDGHARILVRWSRARMMRTRWIKRPKDTADAVRPARAWRRPGGKSGAKWHHSAEEGPDDLDRDDHHQIGDGDRGEEPERGAPAVPARDLPEPVGWGTIEVGHDTADDQDEDDVDGDGEGPEVAAGRSAPRLSATS